MFPERACLSRVCGRHVRTDIRTYGRMFLGAKTRHLSLTGGHNYKEESMGFIPAAAR